VLRAFGTIFSSISKSVFTMYLWIQISFGACIRFVGSAASMQLWIQIGFGAFFSLVEGSADSMKLWIQTVFVGAFFSLVEGSADSMKLWIQIVFGAIFWRHFRFRLVGLVCTWVEVKIDMQSWIFFVIDGLFPCRLVGLVIFSRFLR
jgi:hypothetical protein